MGQLPVRCRNQRDRRAYEMMSDGYVLLANAIMGKLRKKKKILYIKMY